MSEKESIGYWDGSDKPSVVASHQWGSGPVPVPVPVPVNTLRNQDGTSYSAGTDTDMKRFLIQTRGGKTMEGVIFSDGAIIIHGNGFRACETSAENIERNWPDAVIHRLD